MGRSLTPATNLLFGSPVAVRLFTGCIEVDDPPPPEPASASSSSAPELYLGLRGQEAADSIVVTWPDGSVSEEGDVQGGTVLVLP